MRATAEMKRRAILEAAHAVFLEQGYDATSMAQMAARAGGSKQTFYGYFSSKAELFAAVMLEKGAGRAMPIFERLDPRAELGEALRGFGRDFLAFLLSDEILALRRMIVSEGHKSDLGQLFYVNGPKRGWGLMSDYFSAMMANGKMRRADPDRAAAHLQGLLEAGPFERRLVGARGPVSADEIALAVDEAVDIFVRGYGL